MAQNSKIEWTDHTFNPWVGCTNVSPGCDHCYAEAWSKRSGLVKWGKNPRRRTSEAYWRAPMKWQAASRSFSIQNGRRQRVFCASLADVFENKADAEWRSDLFQLIAATPALDWLLLTKRPQNIEKMLPKSWPEGGCRMCGWEPRPKTRRASTSDGRFCVAFQPLSVSFPTNLP
jgi:protein gp37